MPRTENANQRIRDAQRARILEAAKEVFARKGWNTTITDIASAAKVSQGLIYHYFANKETIFGRSDETERKARSRYFSEKSGNPTERLRSGWKN